MANPADEYSEADLKALVHNGWILEDVMDKIWDITKIPLPFSDSIGSTKVKQSYTEWPLDALADPDLTNAVIDGADITQNDATGGTRVGNHCQEMVKRVSVTNRAQNAAGIGGNALSRQVTRRQQELRRDAEAIYLHNQASVADNGDDTAGKLGGLDAWLTTNTDRGSGGADGGFSSGTVSAATAGTARTATMTELRALIAQAWEGGAEISHLMSMPAVIRGISRFLLSSSAEIATLTSEAGQSAEEMTAKASVNVFVTDHGQVLMMRANRLQQESASGRANLYAYDPEYLRIGMLQGIRVEPLAKTGLADKRLMSMDTTLMVLNEASHAVMADIDHTAAWTA